jgi:hypothetical protein
MNAGSPSSNRTTNGRVERGHIATTPRYAARIDERWRASVFALDFGMSN